MSQEVFEWVWLALLIIISTVRKVHEHKAGRRSSLKGIPIPEATMMMLWGLAAGVLPLFYMFSPWLDFANLPFEMPLALRVIGVALFVFAIWLLHRSHADLGKHWSPTVELKHDHALVSEGVYKRIRHPMYAAHVPWGIAQALLLPNLIAGPLALILIFAVMALRIPREERAMIEEFGDTYRRYMERTGRILPECFVDPDPPHQTS
ncbi:protein-S-isoprenylcysteine O-methyltransferase [Myxococcota bacterium]